MNEVDTAERILRFYQECLQGTPPVASMDVIRDSQTARVISEIFLTGANPSILDYGCGSLRLLNALLTNCADRNWSYLGVDVVDPQIGMREESTRLAGLGNGQHAPYGICEPLIRNLALQCL
jgi:hypothetical protein